MSRTKQIKLYYIVEKRQIVPPDAGALARKDAWIAEIQKGMKVKEKKMVELTYKLHNPDILQMMRFFNGVVCEYWTIQTTDMLKGRPDRKMLERYRETLLDDVLGYEVELIDRTVRRRKSTADFRSTQEWHDFMETVRETHFEPEGYQFPDSEHFWEVEGKHGYDAAKKIVIEQLQKTLRHKLSPADGDGVKADSTIE